MTIKIKKRSTVSATRPPAPVLEDTEFDLEDGDEDGDIKGASTMLAKALGQALAPLRADLKALTDRFEDAESEESEEPASANMKGAPVQGEEPEGHGVEVREVQLPPGIRAVRCMKANLVAKMRGGTETTESVLTGWGYAREARAMQAFDVKMKSLVQQRALNTINFTEGGALIPAEYSSEFIALLRNATVIRRMSPPSVTVASKLDIKKQTSGATAYWVGEGQAITPSQQAFGGISLTPKKLAALVPITNDLARNPSAGAEALVRDDLTRAMAIKEDLTFLFGVGGEYSPRGITSLVAAANMYAATAVSATAPTLAEVKTEVSKAKKTMKLGNVPMTRMFWVTSPSVEGYLTSITDGFGTAIFQSALEAANPTFMGYPFFVTNQVAENLGAGGNESRLFLIDADQLILVDSSTLPFTVEAFPNATYDNAGTLESGVSNDSSVIRSMQGVDFNMRYNTAAVVVQLRWGL